MVFGRRLTNRRTPRLRLSLAYVALSALLLCSAEPPQTDARPIPGLRRRSMTYWVRDRSIHGAADERCRLTTSDDIIRAMIAVSTTIDESLFGEPIDIGLIRRTTRVLEGSRANRFVHRRIANCSRGKTIRWRFAHARFRAGTPNAIFRHFAAWIVTILRFLESKDIETSMIQLGHSYPVRRLTIATRRSLMA